MLVHSVSALNKHSLEMYREQFNNEKQFPGTAYIHFKDF